MPQVLSQTGRRKQKVLTKEKQNVGNSNDEAPE